MDQNNMTSLVGKLTIPKTLGEGSTPPTKEELESTLFGGLTIANSVGATDFLALLSEKESGGMTLPKAISAATFAEMMTPEIPEPPAINPVEILSNAMQEASEEVSVQNGQKIPIQMTSGEEILTKKVSMESLLPYFRNWFCKRVYHNEDDITVTIGGLMTYYDYSEVVRPGTYSHGLVTFGLKHRSLSNQHTYHTICGTILAPFIYGSEISPIQATLIMKRIKMEVNIVLGAGNVGIVVVSQEDPDGILDGFFFGDVFALRLV